MPGLLHIVTLNIMLLSYFKSEVRRSKVVSYAVFPGVEGNTVELEWVSSCCHISPFDHRVKLKTKLLDFLVKIQELGHRNSAFSLF